MPDEKPLKILLVEDNDDDAYFIKKALDYKKYELTRLTDGQTALDYLLNSEEKKDVVLLDYKLPYKNGLEIIKEAKRSGKNYPFIFLTVDSSVDTAVEAMRAGAFDFLPKLKGYGGLPEMIEKVYRIHKDILDKSSLEKQLQKHQKMDTLVTLTRGVSHDFNNVLTVIEGNLSLLFLRSDNFTKEQTKFLKNVEKACTRAIDLVAQLRKISKNSVSKKINIDIYDIAQEVFSLLENATDKIIEKRLDIKPRKFFITANPSEINQVFLNLGINAVKAIEERGTKPGDYIKISAENYIVKNQDETGIQSGEYVHILFEDNGTGMTEKIKKKAFDPYFTTRNKGDKEGQGLGLAMVDKIIREHKGSIYIETIEGEKTIFHIFLAKIPSKRSFKTEQKIEIKGGNEVVLVIDDEDMVRDYAVNILKSYGYNVLSAADGQEGLDIIKKHKDSIDLVILDLSMPKISGKIVFEEVLRLNENRKNKYTRVIISSGLNDEETQNDIFVNANGYIPKPYNEKEFAQSVRIVLDL